MKLNEMQISLISLLSIFVCIEINKLTKKILITYYLRKIAKLEKEEKLLYRRILMFHAYMKDKQ